MGAGLMYSSKRKEAPGLEAGEGSRRGRGGGREAAPCGCGHGEDFGLDAKCWGKPLIYRLTSQELLVFDFTQRGKR